MHIDKQRNHTKRKFHKFNKRSLQLLNNIMTNTTPLNIIHTFKISIKSLIILIIKQIEIILTMSR